MADLMHAMNQLRIKNDTIKQEASGFKQQIDELRDQIVEDARKNRQVKEHLKGFTIGRSASGIHKAVKFVKENELLIKNLESWVDNVELKNQFTRFGTVSEVRVVRDILDQSKGFAVLCFNTPGEAKRAMEAMNGAMIGRTAMSISTSVVDRKPGEAHKKEYAKNKIVVKNLHSSLDDEKLKGLFLKFGSIVETKVLCDEKGKSKGIGFVQFFSKNSAECAILEMNGRVIQDICVFVSFSELKPDRPKTNPFKPVTTTAKDKIFVANLPSNMTKHELQALFSRFGPISSAYTSQDKHIGFVQFIFAKDADAAVKTMNGHVLQTKNLRVSLANNKPGQTNDPFHATRKITQQKREMQPEFDIFM